MKNADSRSLTKENHFDVVLFVCLLIFLTSFSASSIVCKHLPVQFLKQSMSFASHPIFLPRTLVKISPVVLSNMGIVKGSL